MFDWLVRGEGSDSCAAVSNESCSAGDPDDALRSPFGEGFDTSGNPVRQSRNQLEITQKNQRKSVRNRGINQKSQNIGSGAREGT